MPNASGSARSCGSGRGILTDPNLGAIEIGSGGESSRQRSAVRTGSLRSVRRTCLMYAEGVLKDDRGRAEYRLLRKGNARAQLEPRVQERRWRSQGRLPKPCATGSLRISLTSAQSNSDFYANASAFSKDETYPCDEFRLYGSGKR